jgi:hypothetical protein
MYKSYLDVISLIERVHRYILELVKLELDGLGIHDISLWGHEPLGPVLQQHDECRRRLGIFERGGSLSDQAQQAGGAR